MRDQELILLGLLKESPKHGYEIKVRIQSILTLFAGIDITSIYYPLKVLEKQGCVVKIADKTGNRPARQVYSLTPKGHARFKELLTQSFLDFRRPQFTLDVSLYFLPFIDKNIARRRLRARSVILKQLEQQLSTLISTPATQQSLPLQRILEHNLRMVQSERKFLGELTGSF
jgi:DNA-binding PadR family transcriptional regulator